MLDAAPSLDSLIDSIPIYFTREKSADLLLNDSKITKSFETFICKIVIYKI